MRVVPNWNEYFMKIAEATSIRSKDPSRQVGCVIVDPESHTVRSGGYNGMVTGLEETDALWERPTKYLYTCHAEFNAIAKAAKNGISIDKCWLYCTCFPCMGCARLLIQAGIEKIKIKSEQIATGYLDEYHDTYALLRKIGIEIEMI
jgi:dCMP deaminase